MIKYIEFDPLIPNLMVPRPGVPPPMENTGKNNISWGGEPPMKTKTGPKMTFLMVPRPENLHAGRYRHGDHVSEGYGAWGDGFSRILGGVPDHEKSGFHGGTPPPSRGEVMVGIGVGT